MVFGLGKKQPEKTGTTAEQWEESLKGRFRHAAHGDFFRTRAFARPEESAQKQTDWLEAACAPDGLWIAQRVTRQDGLAGDGGAVIERANLPGGYGLTFYEAACQLALFESARMEQGCLVTVDPGDAHFTVFSQREGLIFDTNGKPHPVTENGRFVGTGMFTEAALAHVGKAPMMNFDAVPDSLAPSLRIGTREVRLAGRDLTPVDGFYAALNDFRDFVQAANKAGWHNAIKNMPILSVGEDEDNVCYNENFEAQAEQLQNAFEHCAEYLGECGLEDTPFLKEFTRAYRLLDAQAHLSHASNYYRHCGRLFDIEHPGSGDDGWTYTYEEEDLDGLVETLSEKLGDAGCGDIAADSPLMKRLLRQTVGYPPEIDKLVAWFEKTRGLLDGNTPKEPPRAPAGSLALAGPR